jgi:hypothetical protein
MIHVIETILKVLEDPAEHPITKFLSLKVNNLNEAKKFDLSSQIFNKLKQILKLVQESLTSSNNAFAKMIEDMVLPNIAEIAVFKKENKDINRGDTYFSENPSTNFFFLKNYQ